eukprot:g5206.t1
MDKSTCISKNCVWNYNSRDDERRKLALAEENEATRKFKDRKRHVLIETELQQKARESELLSTKIQRRKSFMKAPEKCPDKHFCPSNGVLKSHFAFECSEDLPLSVVTTMHVDDFTGEMKAVKIVPRNIGDAKCNQKTMIDKNTCEGTIYTTKAVAELTGCEWNPVRLVMCEKEQCCRSTRVGKKHEDCVGQNSESCEKSNSDCEWKESTKVSCNNTYKCCDGIIHDGGFCKPKAGKAIPPIGGVKDDEEKLCVDGGGIWIEPRPFTPKCTNPLFRTSASCLSSANRRSNTDGTSYGWEKVAYYCPITKDIDSDKPNFLPRRCPAGWYCRDTGHKARCLKGHKCPGGTKTPVKCASNEIQTDEGQAECIKCPSERSANFERSKCLHWSEFISIQAFAYTASKVVSGQRMLPPIRFAVTNSAETVTPKLNCQVVSSEPEISVRNRGAEAWFSIRRGLIPAAEAKNGVIESVTTSFPELFKDVYLLGPSGMKTWYEVGGIQRPNNCPVPSKENDSHCCWTGAQDAVSCKAGEYKEEAKCIFNSLTGCSTKSGVFVKCMTMPADAKSDEECKAAAAQGMKVLCFVTETITSNKFHLEMRSCDNLNEVIVKGTGTVAIQKCEYCNIGNYLPPLPIGSSINSDAKILLNPIRKCTKCPVGEIECGNADGQSCAFCGGGAKIIPMQQFWAAPMMRKLNGKMIIDDRCELDRACFEASKDRNEAALKKVEGRSLRFTPCTDLRGKKMNNCVGALSFGKKDGYLMTVFKEAEFTPFRCLERNNWLSEFFKNVQNQSTKCREGEVLHPSRKDNTCYDATSGDPVSISGVNISRIREFVINKCVNENVSDIENLKTSLRKLPNYDLFGPPNCPLGPLGYLEEPGKAIAGYYLVSNSSEGLLCSGKFWTKQGQKLFTKMKMKECVSKSDDEMLHWSAPNFRNTCRFGPYLKDNLTELEFKYLKHIIRLEDRLARNGVPNWYTGPNARCIDPHADFSAEMKNEKLTKDDFYSFTSEIYTSLKRKGVLSKGDTYYKELLESKLSPPDLISLCSGKENDGRCELAKVHTKAKIDASSDLIPTKLKVVKKFEYGKMSESCGLNEICIEVQLDTAVNTIFGVEDMVYDRNGNTIGKIQFASEKIIKFYKESKHFLQLLVNDELYKRYISVDEILKMNCSNKKNWKPYELSRAWHGRSLYLDQSTQFGNNLKSNRFHYSSVGGPMMSSCLIPLQFPKFCKAHTSEELCTKVDYCAWKEDSCSLKETPDCASRKSSKLCNEPCNWSTTEGCVISDNYEDPENTPSLEYCMEILKNEDDKSFCFELFQRAKLKGDKFSSLQINFHRNRCKYGSWGNLCKGCIKGFSHDSKGNCIPCHKEDIPWQGLAWIGASILKSIFLIIISTRSTVKSVASREEKIIHRSKEEEDAHKTNALFFTKPAPTMKTKYDKLNVLIKIGTSYMQFLSVATVLLMEQLATSQRNQIDLFLKWGQDPLNFITSLFEEEEEEAEGDDDEEEKESEILPAPKTDKKNFECVYQRLSWFYKPYEPVQGTMYGGVPEEQSGVIGSLTLLESTGLYFSPVVLILFLSFVFRIVGIFLKKKKPSKTKYKKTKKKKKRKFPCCCLDEREEEVEDLLHHEKEEKDEEQKIREGNYGKEWDNWRKVLSEIHEKADGYVDKLNLTEEREKQKEKEKYIAEQSIDPLTALHILRYGMKVKEFGLAEEEMLMATEHAQGEAVMLLWQARDNEKRRKYEILRGLPKARWTPFKTIDGLVKYQITLGELDSIYAYGSEKLAFHMLNVSFAASAFFLYPKLCQAIFDTLACKGLDRNESHMELWLVKDMNYRCHNAISPLMNSVEILSNISSLFVFYAGLATYTINSTDAKASLKNKIVLVVCVFAAVVNILFLGLFLYLSFGSALEKLRKMKKKKKVGDKKTETKKETKKDTNILVNDDDDDSSDDEIETVETLGTKEMMINKAIEKANFQKTDRMKKEKTVKERKDRIQRRGNKAVFAKQFSYQTTLTQEFTHLGHRRMQGEAGEMYRVPRMKQGRGSGGRSGSLRGRGRMNRGSGRSHPS